MNETHFRFMDLAEKPEEDLCAMLSMELSSPQTAADKQVQAGHGRELFGNIFNELSDVVYANFNKVKEDVYYPIDLFPIIFPLIFRLEYLNPAAKLTVAALLCKRLLDEKYMA